MVPARENNAKPAFHSISRHPCFVHRGRWRPCARPSRPRCWARTSGSSPSATSQAIVKTTERARLPPASGKCKACKAGGDGLLSQVCARHGASTRICGLEILFVFGRNIIWFGQLRGGPLRYLGFASSRAAKIYGDLAEIYGASPQFFANVSGLSFAHKTQRATGKSEINVFSIEDRACALRIRSSRWVLLLPGAGRGKTHPTVRPR